MKIQRLQLLQTFQNKANDIKQCKGQFTPLYKE